MVAQKTSIVFVVVADHEAARRLIEDVHPWLEQGLARHFVVVAAVDVLGVEEPLGRWAGEDSASVSCFAALAEQSYDAIRVVAYQELSRGSSGDPRTVRAARELSDSFTYRKAASQVLTSLNVLVPDERVRDLPPDLLELSLSANVVVAPEDRESPKHATHPLSDADRLRVHGLVSLFMTAALWRHQQDGPLDGEQAGSFNEVPNVVMLRAYGRVARAPMLVERIASSVFSQRRTAQWAAEAVNGIPARDPGHISRRQAERFLERHRTDFSLTAPPTPTGPQLRTVGVLEAFAMMLRAMFRGLRELPTEVVGQVSESSRRVAGEVAQSATFGSDSRVRVQGVAGFSGGPSDVCSATIDLASMLLERSGGGSPTPPAAGDAWQDLRAVAFALHDGSEPPEGFERPGEGVVTEVVTDVEWLAPDPLAGPFVVDRAAVGGMSSPVFAPVRVNDAMQASELLDQLETVNATSEATRLRDWCAQRESSLTWRIAQHLAERFRSAETLLGTSLQRVGQGAANLDGELQQQTRSRLLRSWRSWLLTTLILSTLAYGLLVLQGLPLVGTWLLPMLGATVVVWLFGWTLFYLRYLRRVFQIEHRRDRENAEYLAAVSNSLHAAGNLVRLGSHYQQLQDWSEIIGWMLHHPERDLGEIEDGQVQIDLAAPASHRIGRAGWDDRSMRRLAAIVGRSMFGRSWLSNLFVEYRDTAMRQLRYELGLDESAPEPDPDWDTRAPGPRTYLLDQMKRRQLARIWTAKSVEVVQELLNEIDPNELLDSVEDDHGECTAVEFLYGILSDRRGHAERADMALFLWSNQARMTERQRVDHTVLWSSNPLPEDVVGADEGEVARVPLAERSVHDVLVVRADLCSPVPYTDLRLFIEPRLQQPTASTEPDPSSPW